MTPAQTDFVARFAHAWAEPGLDRHEAIWHPQIRLVQPMAPTTVGIPACRDQFRRLFALIPDLRAEVHRACADGDLVFIEFTLSGTFGGRPIRWRAVDRFHLEDGLVRERVSYFDSLPLALNIAARPRGWRRWLRSGLRPSLR